MNRGRRRENVFLDAADYQAFTDLLKETSETWNVKIAAYCLMPNHYHLLINTPEGNIARAMRHLNGVFTQRFNKRHGCDGQLFRGRYKSILVDGDIYLLQLVRYLHLNPVKAGLVENASQYAWSSCRAYLSTAKKWDWLYKEFVFGVLADDPKAQIKAWRRFMRDEETDPVQEIMDGKTQPAVLGPPDFLDWVKETYYKIETNNETPQIRELRPDVETIFSSVCRYYGIDRERLFITKRGEFNEPRSVAIYLVRSLRRESLIDTGRYFQIDNYSSVSSVIERFKTRMNNNRTIRNRMKAIRENIKMSQEQT